MGRFETETFSTKENLKPPMDLAQEVDRPGPSPSQSHQAHPRHGRFRQRDLQPAKEGTAYNGYFECTCYYRGSSSTSLGTWSGSCYAAEITPAPSSGGGLEWFRVWCSVVPAVSEVVPTLGGTKGIK
jgi:hypothetical protein